MHHEFCPRELRKDIGDAYKFPCTCGFDSGDAVAKATRGGPSTAAREKGALAKRSKKLNWNGSPNKNYQPISLRLAPEKR